MLEFILLHTCGVFTTLGSMIYILAVISALHALLTKRWPQGAIAWALGLLSFPYVILFLYWIFGRDKFRGYVAARRQDNQSINHIPEIIREQTPGYRVLLEPPLKKFHVLEELASMPFTNSNDISLLIDGMQTFSTLFSAIDSAEEYILVQFFIVYDDKIGRELSKRLIAQADAGIRIYFIIDEFGSRKLPKSFIQKLRDHGVHILPFNTRRGIWNRFQLNFRNHRKLVIIDGKRAFAGGLNVGESYIGQDPRFTHWRDTHVQFTGPSVTAAQLCFLEDWYWAARSIPTLNWEPQKSPSGDKHMLVLPTGPADTLDSCSLFFTHLINSAQRRIWIVSPYFVPNSEVVVALQLAALRGVDVRILLPNAPDHLSVFFASYWYVHVMAMENIRFYRYTKGFLHQKVILVDDECASVGSANADNRSFRLNFEISIVTLDRDFASQVEAMLKGDFANSYQTSGDEYNRLPLPKKAAVKIARLFSPIL